MGHLKLDDLLEELRDDGVTDSSGVFTLNASKARDKLRNFRFSSPEDYLLKIVQCAVAGGARNIDVLVRSTYVRISFDGAPVDGEDVKSLVGHLLADRVPGEKRRFRHLAAGLRGAEAVRPGSVRFDYWDGERRQARIWDQKGWRETEGEKGLEDGLHAFTLNRTFKQSFSAAGKEIRNAFEEQSKTCSPEERVLLLRCRYCPASVTLDGKPIQPAEFGQPRYRGYDISRDPNPGEARPPSYIPRHGLIDGLVHEEHHLMDVFVGAPKGSSASLFIPPSQATLQEGPEEEGGERCIAWYALKAGEAPAEITYVEDGVALAHKPAPIVCPGFVGVYSAEELTKDLTGFQLVEDQAYREHVLQAEQIMKRMREKVSGSLSLFPIRERIRSRLG